VVAARQSASGYSQRAKARLVRVSADEQQRFHTCSERIMKFICLGCLAEQDWEARPKSDREAFFAECFAYDSELRRNGHWLDGGQALEGARTAKTLRWKNGQVIVTDGPFAETKELLGGIGILEARDMDHAVELMSKHPGVRIGPFEIRPVNEAALERQRAWKEDSVSRVAAPAEPGSNAETKTFACLGYTGEQHWDTIPKCEQETMMKECIAFDEARRKNGQWVSGIALEGAWTAKTLRAAGGKVVVTDGPYAETKEQLGGVVVNRIKDMKHAVELLSAHPALRYGVTIEIRPIDEEMTARCGARKDRPSKG
jgi:hypothetical protein